MQRFALTLALLLAVLPWPPPANAGENIPSTKVTPEERDTFATLAETWRGMAASAERFRALLDLMQMI